MLGHAQPSGSVVLSWSPNTEEDLAGYIVLRGETSGAYDYQEDVGNITEAIVGGLTPGKTYFFSVLAYNLSGQRSDPAKEVIWTTEAGLPVSGISGWEMHRDAKMISMRWSRPAEGEGVGRWRVRYRAGAAGAIVEVMTTEPELKILAPGSVVYTVLIAAEGLRGWGPETRFDVPSLPKAPESLEVKGGKTIWTFGTP